MWGFCNIGIVKYFFSLGKILDLGVFGNMIFFIPENSKKIIKYRRVPLIIVFLKLYREDF